MDRPCSGSEESKLTQTKCMADSHEALSIGRGLTPSTTIEHISLVGNPIANCFHYRIMAIAACGKSLRMIDNKPVRKTEIDQALSLGKVYFVCTSWCS